MSKWAGGGFGKQKFAYVKSGGGTENEALKYASKLQKCPLSTSITVAEDYNDTIKNGCIYIPNFFGEQSNRQLFDNLKTELSTNSVINWSKHQKYDNPEFSPTFRNIIDKMANHFGVKVLQTRMNYYKDTTAYKPLHRDSHAYYTNEDGVTLKENFTMGASFGFTRELEIVHESSGMKFSFPQKNNDFFGFDDKVNEKFLHGVPKFVGELVPGSDRISVIAWGIRS